MGSEALSTDAVAAQKPVISREFPDPTDADFDDDISEEEKKYYMTKFKDLNRIKSEKLHCTACDRHMGCAARNDGRMRSHPMLRTLVCRACHAFYNSGEFERGDDGSELYCRWCGQGGQVYCCSSCPIVFCAKCVKRNFSSAKIKEIESVDDWKCFKCVSGVLWDLRATCWALLRFCDLKNKESTKASTTAIQVIRSEKKTNAQKCKEYREIKKLEDLRVPKNSARRSGECCERDQLQEIKKPKTVAQRSKKYREGQKIKKETELQQKNTDRLQSTSTKTPAEYMKEYRRKVKLKNQKIQLNALLAKGNSQVLAYITEDPELKEKYQKACLVDDSDCCKKRKTTTQGRKKDKLEEKKQEEKKLDEKKQEDKKPPIILKRMPEIHIKKFAHQDACFNPIRINKRPGSPLYKKITLANAPIPIAPAPQIPFIMTNPPMVTIPQQKKIKLANIESLKAPPPPIITKTYSQRKMQKPKTSPMLNATFNGFQTQSSFATLSNDTINLSLDSLTQGLDIATVSAYNEAQSQTDESINMNEDDVVCTPDFPLEPLCEVTEDNNDDDVECITPGPLLVPRPMATMAATSTSVASTSISKMPPLVPRISQEDIVQMTDNDVTINKSTGGLKFRVDPQTLSANKMYRLPDGRVFAINANPNMPGGYSATIVAVAETTSGMRNMPPPSRVTYAAKLSTVIPATPPPPPPPLRPNTRSSANTTPKTVQVSTNTHKVKRVQKTKRKTVAEKIVDLKTPVEWYRYNLVDAEDLMSYVLKRLKKLKATAEITDLRKKDINEMKMMHKHFDQLLRTSITRFTEVKESLNQGYKEWSKAKSGKEAGSDDDDDVEILGDESQPVTEKANNISADSDDPIFIDENSNDSVKITCDEMSNDNEAISSPTIVISEQTDNISQDTVPIITEVRGTSRTSDKEKSPRDQEMETSSVPNLNEEELITDETMDTVVRKDAFVSSASTNVEVKNSVTVPIITEVRGTSRTSDKEESPRDQEMVTSSVPNLDEEELITDETMDTVVRKNAIVSSASTNVEVKNSVTVELENDPKFISAIYTDLQVNSAKNNDVQVNSADNTDVQVDLAKTEDDTKLSSSVNSVIPKNNSILSSPILDEARNDEAVKSSNDTAIAKEDSIDHEISRGEYQEAQTLKDGVTSSVASETINVPLSQIEVCAISQESVVKVNGDNSEPIDICPQSTLVRIEDNSQVDTTSHDDKNNVRKLTDDRTVSPTAEDSSEISDKGDKKGVTEIDCGKNVKDKHLSTNSRDSDRNKINKRNVVNSDIIEDLDDESLGETVTSKSANVDELASTTDIVFKEVKSKAAEGKEMVHRGDSMDKMDIDSDLNEEELLNGDKTEKGDGDRDDIAISEDLINDLLDDNLGPGGEDKIPNLNIPCQP